MKTYLKVDELKCKKCSICSSICPSRITISERILSGLENKGCCSCLHCYAACPHEAISGEKGKPYVIDIKKCTKCGICMDKCKFEAIVLS